MPDEGKPLQSRVLLDFVQGEKGTKWASERKGWDNDTFVCEWEGIQCDSLSFVTEINLEASSLIATIPPSLSSIDSLKIIILSDNALFGTLPQSLGTNFPLLTEIDLSGNKLRGALPDFQSETLEVVNLSHNDLSGNLPPDFGSNLEKVRVLDFQGNRLHGKIPTSLSKMKSLVELDLSDNMFSGLIPDKLGMLKDLEFLFISNNKLVGHLPTSLTKDHLVLKEVYLHGNLLSGTVPVTLADLPKLEVLFVDDNKFTGTVPVELCDKNLNEAFFSGSHSDEQGRDGCNSIACPVGYKSSRNETKDGVFPCAKCEHDYLNPYLGSNECHKLDQLKVLKQFFHATGGENWKSGGETWIDDNITVCDKHGISCAENGSVIAIKLSDMNLSGTLPGDLGLLRSVEVLDVSDNMLYGELPSDLRFLPLESLDISGNMLTGSVAPELCHKYGINGNGETDEYLCSNLACPVGTYNAIGRTDSTETECIPCPESSGMGLFLASKECITNTVVVASASNFSIPSDFNVNAVMALAFVSVISISFIVFLVLKVIDADKEDSEGNYQQGEETSRKSVDDDSINFNQISLPGTFPDSGFEGTTQNLWNVEKHGTKEVWLDVPKIDN